jgi:hypothetical protein
MAIPIPADVRELLEAPSYVHLSVYIVCRRLAA